jgi:hypothetical protein
MKWQENMTTLQKANNHTTKDLIDRDGDEI